MRVTPNEPRTCLCANRCCSSSHVPTVPCRRIAADCRSGRSGLTLSASLVESDDLLRGGREVLIRHGDEVYRLRHTRNDKLILTK